MNAVTVRARTVFAAKATARKTSQHSTIRGKNNAIRTILLGAALLVTACGNDYDSSDANALTLDDILIDENGPTNIATKGDTDTASLKSGDRSTLNDVKHEWRKR